MADDLKKVGLVFNADGSTNFVKSLKLVNASLKENYEDFKLVQAQWDKNTTGAQKLADKLVYLNNAYDVQSNKVLTLKKDLEALEKGEGKNTEAIAKKTNTLEKAETKLENQKEKVEKLKKELETLSNSENKNSEAITKKAVELAKAEEKLNSYSKNVIKLKKDLEELEKSEGRDELAIQKKRAELVQAEAGLQRYQNQIKETSKKIKLGTADLEDFAKKLDKVGDNLEKAGKKMLVFSAGYVAALGASVKSAIDFESAFAGVEKTVNGTEEQLAGLKQGIRDMSKEIPASTTEISAVAEAAGQLGIKTEDILGFTKVMIDLGESTNLSSSEAATALARFANITQMSQKDFGKLGSTVVDLGNNFATTEAEIVEMALRLAGAGKVVGMSESDILSFSAALSSVGIEAEAGGSAFSKVMVEIESMVASNSVELEKWAKVAGMSTEDFKKAWEEDAAGALTTFITGLGELDKNGGNSITTLEDLGITEVRMRDALLRASGAGDLFTNALKTGSEAWKENNALITEAEKRYATTESQLQIAKNTLNDIGITIGEKLLPILNDFLDKFKGVLEWFGTLSPEMQNTILIIGGLVAAIGPLLLVLGMLASSISSIITFYTAFIAPMLARSSHWNRCYNRTSFTSNCSVGSCGACN